MTSGRSRIRRHPERALQIPADAEAILQEARRVILEPMIARYFPDRAAGHDYAHITEGEDKATRVIEVRIEEMSAKGRTGGPRGAFDDDPATPGSAGIHPVTSGV